MTNSFDRDSLIDSYVRQLLDGMDTKTMEAMIYDTLKDGFESYSDEELITEIKQYDPELLEN